MIMVAKFEKKGRRTGTKKNEKSSVKNKAKRREPTPHSHESRPERPPVFSPLPARHPQPGVARTLPFSLHTTKPTPMAPAALYLLHESASGYALLHAHGLDAVGASTDAVQASVTDLDRFGKVRRGGERGEGARRGQAENNGQAAACPSKRAVGPGCPAFPAFLSALPLPRAPQPALGASVARGEREGKTEQGARRAAAAPADA